MTNDNYRIRIYGRYIQARVQALAPPSLAGMTPRASYLHRLVRKHSPAGRNAAMLDVGCVHHGALIHFAREAGKSTLRIDCDLRRPSGHSIFGLRNFTGVGSLLAGEHELEEVWQQPLPDLRVVTSGTMPPNPVEFLVSKRFSGLAEQVREQFDDVLLDASPVGLVSDPAILAAQTDGVLLVFDFERTGRNHSCKAYVTWKPLRLEFCM